MEEFRAVPSYPDYEVSRTGVVRRRTPARGTVVGRVLKARLDEGGYVSVNIRRPDAKIALPVRVHTLVAQTWIGPIPPGGQVHHKNEDRSDPRSSNLKIKLSNRHHLEEHRGYNSCLRRYDEPNELIVCACGCGEGFLKYDERGRPRRFVTAAHAGRALGGRPPQIKEVMPL